MYCEKVATESGAYWPRPVLRSPALFQPSGGGRRLEGWRSTAEVSALRLLAAGSPPVFRRWADPRPAPDSGLRTLSRLCPPASGLRPPASGLCSDSALRTPDSGLCPDSLRTATADVDPQSPKSLKTCLPSLVSRKEECSEHQRDEAYKPGASDLRNAAFSDKSCF